MDKQGIGRRQLLGAAGLAASAALVETAALAAPRTSGTWDLVTDIVCVGSGIAGCGAAVMATDAGSKVLLVEKMPVLGGTTSKSGGVLWVPNNYLLREAGIDDRKTDCLNYMARMSYPQTYSPGDATLGLDPAEYRLLEAFYDNARVAVDRLRALGACQFRQFMMFDVNKQAPDYADHLPENKVPHGRCLEPIGGAAAIGGGSLIIAQMETWLRARQVPIWTEAAVQRLVREDGRVIGVELMKDTRTLRVRARQGVIFASGGYAHNVELVRRHQVALYGSCALAGSTGDFIGIAGGVGAKMGPLGTAWRTQVLAEEAFEDRMVGQGAFFLPGDSMVVLNKYGRRVVNEKRDYNDRTNVHFVYDPTHEDYPNQFLFMIFDERTRDAFGGAFPLPTKVEGDSYLVAGRDWPELFGKLEARLASLAAKTGGFRLAPEFAETARKSLAVYDGYARAGVDPEFNRGAQAYDRDWHLMFSPLREGTKQPANPMPNITMHPFAPQGPYYAFLLSAGALDTSGGPLIDHEARVIGHDGVPIAGLYGAGNCVAAPTRGAYYGAGLSVVPEAT